MAKKPNFFKWIHRQKRVKSASKRKKDISKKLEKALKKHDKKRKEIEKKFYKKLDIAEARREKALAAAKLKYQKKYKK